MIKKNLREKDECWSKANKNHYCVVTPKAKLENHLCYVPDDKFKFLDRRRWHRFSSTPDIEHERGVKSCNQYEK